MLAFALVARAAPAQQPDDGLSRLVTKGQVTVQGQAREFIVRHLPPASFPDLPHQIAEDLNQRGCLIPQTYEAHQPENVVHGSFARPGSSDWAVLCSAEGTVSLLVYMDGNAEPVVLATAQENRRLQTHDTSGVLGFNWAIDVVNPEAVHEKQSGLTPKPPMLDHDALADAVVDHRTIYHYHSKGHWSLLEMPD